MSHFRQGDFVSYIGKKTFKDDSGEPFTINGRMGTVFAPVVGSETELVVEFGDESFVMDEKVLERWRPNKDAKEKSPAGPEVTTRRKRRVVDEDEE